MRARLTADDAYTELFHWGDRLERDGAPETVAQAIVAELDAQHQTIDWRAVSDELRARKA